MKWILLLIIIVLLGVIVHMRSEAHNCSLSDVPPEEVISTAKDAIALAKTYGGLENMSIESVEWYLDNEPEKVKRRWNLYMLSETFK